jgi:ATP:ADP antiporter, AAA family
VTSRLQAPRSWFRTFDAAAPHERKATLVAFCCNFILLGSYYILRPVRDAMATVVGVDQLQNLFTGTFLLTLVCAPVFAWLVGTFKLSSVLIGAFWFLILNLLFFILFFGIVPENHLLATAFYWWFSVVNLLMVSLFWSLIVDVFTADQASRLIPFIAAGGSLGAIAGPLVASLFSTVVGIQGLLVVAAVGLLIVIHLVGRLMREKVLLQQSNEEAQGSTLDHELKGHLLDGFSSIFKSLYLSNLAVFFILMTWISTIGYFIQTDFIASAFTGVEARTQALAEIDLAVNICSFAVLLFGLKRFILRFGVTASLILNPVLMAVSFVLFALSPTLLMIQAMQGLRRVTQYAIARPSREICFTVVPQEQRYKAKNVIDTVVYRLGDLTAAWGQAGLRSMGFGFQGAMVVGVIVSGVWGLTAWGLGRQYERRRSAAPAP